MLKIRKKKTNPDRHTYAAVIYAMLFALLCMFAALGAALISSWFNF